MKRLAFLNVFILGLLGLGACSSPSAPPENGPERVKVQHVLIAFQGTLPDKPLQRTQAEAQALAQEVLKRAQAGEDFDALVRQYTDDQAPGIYGLVNDGVAPATDFYPRSGMVKAFGDVAFGLPVGQIGMASYDPQASPFGWHILKRLE